MKGYTIVELLIVMLILSVLIADFNRTKYTANTCKKLNIFLAQAQNKALVLGKNITVEFNQNSAHELESNNYFYLNKHSKFLEIKFGNLVLGPYCSTYEGNSQASPGRIIVDQGNNKNCGIIQSILGARRIEE